ncbi:MAG: WG repeat-containing protein [Bacteroidales bacterium]|nr:WG repeat-containing protein [Bacteroidales bacterium]
MMLLLHKALVLKVAVLSVLFNLQFSLFNSLVSQEAYPMLFPCRCETGEWGYVDSDNEWAIRPIYDAVLYETNGGMYPVSVGGKWGFVGVSGESLTDVAYDAAVCEIDYRKNNYGEYYAALRRKGKWAFIDVQGKFVTDFKYDEVLIMNGKYIIRVRDGKKMRSGYLSVGGKEVWND